MKRSINSSEILIIIAIIVQLFLIIKYYLFFPLYIFILGMFIGIMYVLFPNLEKTFSINKEYKTRMKIINLEKKGDNLLFIT